MNAGDKLAQIAETQIGTRGDMSSGRAALYGYLMATDANLSAFDPEWARRGFGESASSRFRLLNPGGAAATLGTRIRSARASGDPAHAQLVRCVCGLVRHATTFSLASRDGAHALSATEDSVGIRPSTVGQEQRMCSRRL
jgi:hypothetical protein